MEGSCSHNPEALCSCLDSLCNHKIKEHRDGGHRVYLLDEKLSPYEIQYLISQAKAQVIGTCHSIILKAEEIASYQLEKLKELQEKLGGFDTTLTKDLKQNLDNLGPPGEHIKRLNELIKQLEPKSTSSSSEYTVVSGSQDATIRVWKNRESRVLLGHTGAVHSIDVSRNKNFIASGSKDKTIIIWNFYTGQILNKLRGHENAVFSLAISSQDEFLVSGSADKTIRVWRLDSGQQVRVLNGHTNTVRSVAISGRHDYIISGGNDNTVRVWSLNSGMQVRELNGHTDWVLSVAISEDYIFSGSKDTTVGVWSIDSGDQIISLIGHNGPVFSVGFSTRLSSVVSGSADSTIKVWSLVTGSETNTIQLNSKIHSIDLCGSDETYLASGDQNCSVRIREFQTNKEVEVLEGHEGHVWSVKFI